MTVLTIAIPTFNMEWCLERNLLTYCSERLKDKLQVIVLNNASEDKSKEIARKICDTYPNIFLLANRDNRGYGSSINDAIAMAEGKYFRIIDADDWVDTKELERFVEQLSMCQSDIVQTDYTIENMQSKVSIPVSMSETGAEYGRIYTEFSQPIKSLPSIHSTTYRTELLRKSGFYMQDKLYFVDEEYVTIPFLSAKDIVYYPINVYHYLIQNPAQSTSPKNRGKYADHREKVLKRLIGIYQEEKCRGAGSETLALDYCFERIRRGVADHFTTLYIYVQDRTLGRKMANKWQSFIADTVPEMLCNRKRRILFLMNIFRVGPGQYVFLKEHLLH